MDAQHAEATHNHQNPKAHGASPASAGTSARWSELARRARVATTRLPAQLEAQMKRNPALALGIACLAGVGVGTVLSSRILRTIFTTMASAGAVELIRAYGLPDALRAKAA
jgi:hypothetical protein